MGSLRVGLDWATSLSLIEEGNGNPLQCSCLENPWDGGAWWAADYRVAQSQTRLKWLSSSSKFVPYYSYNFSEVWNYIKIKITKVNNIQNKYETQDRASLVCVTVVLPKKSFTLYQTPKFSFLKIFIHFKIFIYLFTCLCRVLVVRSSCAA